MNYTVDVIVYVPQPKIRHSKLMIADGTKQIENIPKNKAPFD